MQPLLTRRRAPGRFLGEPSGRYPRPCHRYTDSKRFPSRPPNLKVALRLLCWLGWIRLRVGIFNSSSRRLHGFRRPMARKYFTIYYTSPPPGRGKRATSNNQAVLLQTLTGRSRKPKAFHRLARSPLVALPTGSTPLQLRSQTAGTATASRARRPVIGCQSSGLVSRFLDGPMELPVV